ncbi:MAG: hypothetical protein ACPLPS_04100 [bacterium]
MKCEYCGKEINPSEGYIAVGTDELGFPTKDTKFYHYACAEKAQLAKVEIGEG